MYNGIWLPALGTRTSKLSPPDRGSSDPCRPTVSLVNCLLSPGGPILSGALTKIASATGNRLPSLNHSTLEYEQRGQRLRIPVSPEPDSENTAEAPSQRTFLYREH